jgi:hypothetical protein
LEKKNNPSNNPPLVKGAKNRLDPTTSENIVIENKKRPTDLKMEIKSLDPTIKELEKQLKNHMKDMKKQDLPQKIKDAKKKWIQPNSTSIGLSNEDQESNTATYKEVNTLKGKKRTLLVTIEKTQQQLSDARYKRYIKTKALSFGRNKATSNSTDSSCKLTEPLPKIVEKTEKLRIDQDVCHNYCYSGTDNGIVKMTGTIPMDIERFKYHLSLRNRFSPLAQDNIDIGSGHTSAESDQSSSPQFSPLPKSFTVNSEDIDVVCGYRRARKKLERKKKLTEDGRKVLEIEKKNRQKVAFIEQSMLMMPQRYTRRS